ncbi:SDR family NAD(P)-dependent oxidoreductase [Streptomyces sp. NPDC102395]|uniref:SDR family NAD(P)-dependent oxidoreductase n=1 Tax=Streptomyces sp. NPDC102395 TaxID=3366168 RepID=UPI00381279B6
MKQSGVVSDDFKRVESHDCPMATCVAPAGSPCRTGKGKVAIQYHTARFRLVPQLAKALNVPTPRRTHSGLGMDRAAPARARRRRTGAGSGIGEATARLLAQRGTAVLLAGRQLEPLARIAADIAAKDGQALAVQGHRPP